MLTKNSTETNLFESLNLFWGIQMAWRIVQCKSTKSKNGWNFQLKIRWSCPWRSSGEISKQTIFSRLRIEKILKLRIGNLERLEWAHFQSS